MTGYNSFPTTTPVSRDARWHDIHLKHVRLANSNKNICELVLFGDSIVSGLSRYANVWKYFRPMRTLNMGIGGDRTQHVLWRAQNMVLPTNVNIAVLHCGTNNIDRDSPRDIANGIASIGVALQERKPGLKIVLTGLLPRDLFWSLRRDKIQQTNIYLEDLCRNELMNFYYMKQDTNWVLQDGKLNVDFYYDDHLHLNEAGNELLAKSIKAIYCKINDDEDDLHPHPSFTFEDGFAIGQSECLGRGWNGEALHHHPIHPPPLPLSSQQHPPSPTPPNATSFYNVHFPPLPSTYVSHPCFVPCTVTRPVTRQYSLPVSHPVSCPASYTVSHPISRPVFRPVYRSVCESFVVSHSVTPNHTSSIPIRKFSRPKPPKWVKCDYIHHPPPPLPPLSPIKCSHSHKCITKHVPQSPPLSSPPSSSLSTSSSPSLPDGKDGGGGGHGDDDGVDDDDFSSSSSLYLFNFLIMILFFAFVLISLNFLSIHHCFYKKGNFNFYKILFFSARDTGEGFYIRLGGFLSNIYLNSFLHTSFYILDYNINLFHESDMMAGTSTSYRYNCTIVPVRIRILLQEGRDLGGNTCLVFLLLLGIVIVKLKNLQKKHPIFLMSYSIICSFLILFLLRLNYQSNHNKCEIKACTKSSFFTIETIYISNNISKSTLKTNMCFFMISKLKSGYRKQSLLLKFLLLLSGDISLNPGPNHDQTTVDDDWKLFNKRGLHFLHININSLLPKIDEIRYFTKKSNAAVIGITESKLDKSVLDSEINIDGYEVLRCDRNRNGGGVACYIREDIGFDVKSCLSNDIEHIFFDVLLPKT